MLKESELRIGNIIQLVFSDHTNIGIVESISTQSIQLNVIYSDGKNKLADNSERQGVPLTEEWLLKFGFEGHGEGIMQDIYTLKYFNVQNSEAGFLHLGSQVALRYVHQLQNLYFALTGEELTIKKEEETRELYTLPVTPLVFPDRHL